MKRHTAIITIITIVLCMNLSSFVFAAENHGGEAHSPSMSVESGEEPISDMTTTEDTGKIDAGEVLGEPDADEEAAPEETVPDEEEEKQAIQDVEEAKDTAKESLLEGMKKMLVEKPVIWIAGIAVIGVGSVVAEIMVTKRRRKEKGGKSVKKKGSDKHYKGKH